MNELPKGLEEFLTDAGWGGAAIDPIPGDASFRRYFRIRRDDGSTPARAMLMYAPPPEEDPQPFLEVGAWLNDNGFRAPQIYHEKPAQGWVLTEDFGDDRMREWIEANPSGEIGAYKTAVDVLSTLSRTDPGPFAPYDMDVYLREVGLLVEWYCPAMNLSVDDNGFYAAWTEALTPLIDAKNPGVTVLRDYHAENIMMLSPEKDGEAAGTGAQGLIDFQDALVGHPAYDLVSLLQDARREVSTQLERDMLDFYRGQCGLSGEAGDQFEADYARLGAQRNAKIVGIFTRLYKRDGKPRYLDLIPRVWEAMERDLAHPGMAPVARWFDANIPPELRKAHGGKVA
ncbi:phosphotransferase [Erythrobacter sp. Alg231-14]|uniref:phosphotransferase n=1 Tax=Erythrobacter sp. Alg231-14 TaxID=1922225 RepID=UPI000D5543AD